MAKWMKRMLILLACGFAACAGLMSYIVYYYTAPGPLTAETTLIFRHGEKFQAMAGDLAQARVIHAPLLFEVLAAASGEAGKFKAGEYRFAAGISPRQVIGLLAEGRVVVHKLTVPEGLTVAQVLQLVKNEPVLEGDVPAGVVEGSLLPETYQFRYGDTRQDLVERMQKGMSSLLHGLWQNRKAGLPLASPQQALTLASIVEKETGVAGERGRVAAVFINRLRKGMKLQSDPTVAYGIEQQTGAPLGRKLTLDDLRSNTPYNTYVIPALPPGPIANPGRAALAAVLNPPDTQDLYFVATGTGGHNFANTLEQHDKNVRQYRAHEKQ